MATDTLGSASTSRQISEISPCKRALMAFIFIDEAMVMRSTRGCGRSNFSSW